MMTTIRIENFVFRAPKVKFYRFAFITGFKLELSRYNCTGNTKLHKIVKNAKVTRGFRFDD